MASSVVIGQPLNVVIQYSVHAYVPRILGQVMTQNGRGFGHRC